MHLNGRATGIWLDDASAIPMERTAPSASLTHNGRGQVAELGKFLQQARRKEKPIADNYLLHG